MKPKSKSIRKRGKSYRDEKAIKRFGLRIKEIREAKDMTQEDLEHDTGFDLSQIGRTERGEINTSISHAEKIAECLGVPTSHLFSDKPVYKKPSKALRK